jgi:hypothetical protein
VGERGREDGRGDAGTGKGAGKKGSGNNGTIEGCEWVDEGKFKGALKFPADSSINVPDRY